MISWLPYILLAVSVTFAAVLANETVDPATKSANTRDLPPALKMLAKDSDGLISRDEGLSNEYVARYWDKLDTNFNGNVDNAEFALLESVLQREQSLKTDHPQDVQQFKNGKYISPNEQIERNKQ